MNFAALELLRWIALIAAVLVAPPLLIGLIRKNKASLQNRFGAPIYQPFLDLAKLLGKGELLSDSASWVLRGTSVINAAVAILLALSTPWIPGMPMLFDIDIFLFLYLFVVIRFFTVLSSLDTASPFGGFAASREITLAVLVEPAFMLCLLALAVVARSTSLTEIFSFHPGFLADNSGLWALAGCGLFLSSLVELSRMPADDPTTHLELTMVHEAMILENSGPNLALTEYATALKMLVLMGISAQCFIHAIKPIWSLSLEIQALSGLVALLLLVLAISLIEATAVKLRWTKLPEFIAYAVTFGFLCSACAIGTLR